MKPNNVNILLLDNVPPLLLIVLIVSLCLALFMMVPRTQGCFMFCVVPGKVETTHSAVYEQRPVSYSDSTTHLGAVQSPTFGLLKQNKQNS